MRLIGMVHREHPNTGFPEGSCKILGQVAGVRGAERCEVLWQSPRDTPLSRTGTPGSVKWLHNAVTWDSQVLWVWSVPYPLYSGKKYKWNWTGTTMPWSILWSVFKIKSPEVPWFSLGICEFHNPKQRSYTKTVISSPRKINQCLPSAPTSFICHVSSSPPENIGKHIYTFPSKLKSNSWLKKGKKGEFADKEHLCWQQ